MSAVKLTEEDLEAWRESPVTRQVMAALSRVVDRRRQSVTSEAWDSGAVDKEAWARAHAWQQILADLTEATAENINEWNEPERPDPA